MPGPRILAATLPLGATGGHADGGTGFAPNIEFHGETGVADGVDAVRARVREDVKHGADVIKFMASAGVLSNEASVGAPQYSQAEMDAIVDEAHRWGKKVAAHAHGAEAIKMAIRAGVDSVEHCSFIDDEGLKLAKQHGTYLDFDIYNDDYILAEFGKLGVPQAQIDKEKLVGRVQRENFRKAVQAGEKMAFAHRRRRVSARLEREAVRQGSGVGHDAAAGDPLGDGQCRRPAGLERPRRRAASRGITPT